MVTGNLAYKLQPEVVDGGAVAYAVPLHVPLLYVTTTVRPSSSIFFIQAFISALLVVLKVLAALVPPTPLVWR